MRKHLTIIALFILTISLHAEVKLPALVGSNMVLQQKEDVVFWGWANAGEKVTVQPSWIKKGLEVTTPTNGEWKLRIKTPKAGGPYEIDIKGENTIKLTNVLVGDVWICSGQSNMHLPVGRTEKSWKTGVVNWKEEVQNANYPEIRLFTVDRLTSDTLLNDVKGEWQQSSSEAMYEFSGVAYFFGRELYLTQHIPIGLINCSWGGTPAEAWVKKSVLEADVDFVPLLKNYEDLCTNYPENIAKFKVDNQRWKEAADSLKKLGEKPTKSAPRRPIGAGSHKAPNLIYNAMVNPMLNTKIKGVIWYQGENNARLAYQYRKLFPALIENWRDDFDSGDFPFYFVQIAPHRSQNPEIRESQLLTLKSVKNTGMAVTTDVGDTMNIHPLNKQVVGQRLALWARANTYNEKGLVYSGPLYREMEIKGDKIYLSFDHIGSGLLCKGDALTNFTICGSNKEFVSATAVIEGDKIVVSAETIKNPISVRFGWNYTPFHNLYNAEGLPASPFRTDDWPGATYKTRFIKNL